MNLAGERKKAMQQSVHVFRKENFCVGIKCQSLSRWSIFRDNSLPNRLSLQSTRLHLQQESVTQILTVMVAFLFIFGGHSCLQHWLFQKYFGPFVLCCVIPV